MSDTIKVNESKSSASNAILIGEGLFTNKDYHLLVEANGVSIDKIMTIDEYETIVKIFNSLGLLNNNSTVL
jgi:hypothetical protein